MGRSFTAPPGTPVDEPSANRSLFTLPSIWMVLNRSFCPLIDRPLGPGAACGDVLTKSVKDRFSVGRRWMLVSEMNVLAPVLATERRGSETPATVIPAT